MLISKLYPQFTRASLAKLFDGVHIKVDNKPIKHGYKLRLGNKIRVDIGPLTKKPQIVVLPIIYEDGGVVVMDKPAGMLTHSKGSFNNEPTVASFLSTVISDKNLGGNRAGIVHRLDRATSGVIIGAKTLASQIWLQKQFSDRKVKKTYLALIEGIPQPPSAIVDAPIGRNPKRPQTFKVVPDGRSAQTEYKLTRTSAKKAPGISLVKLRPKTGRTHQLRVHMAYIGHPIVGDSVYGHQGPRMMLHASELELAMPNGQVKHFKAPLPPDFKE